MKHSFESIVKIENDLVDILLETTDNNEPERLVRCLSIMNNVCDLYPFIKKFDYRLICSYLIVIISIIQNRDIFDEIGKEYGKLDLAFVNDLNDLISA